MKLSYSSLDFCHADPPRSELYYLGGANYGKPHIPVKGRYDGQIIYSCLFCGKTLK